MYCIHGSILFGNTVKKKNGVESNENVQLMMFLNKIYKNVDVLFLNHISLLSSLYTTYNLYFVISL